VPFALTKSLPRLYAILDVDLTLARGRVPLDVLDAWLEAGIRLVQVRAKSWPGGPLLELAEEAVARGHAAGAMVIVNDRADTARLAAADGVHIGQDDLPAVAVRLIAGPGAVIGLSTHSDAQVEAACGEPVDYIAIGPVFESATRMAVSEPLGPAGVASAVARATRHRLPVVAIGGITAENAARVLEAGAASVAVIGALVEDNPRANARRLLAAMTSPL
jgi:thiamine-phosphate pyrophosphorylase